MKGSRMSKDTKGEKKMEDHNIVWFLKEKKKKQQ